jgi:hypothetical protein
MQVFFQEQIPYCFGGKDKQILPKSKENGKKKCFFIEKNKNIGILFCHTKEFAYFW